MINRLMIFLPLLSGELLADWVRQPTGLLNDPHSVRFVDNDIILFTNNGGETEFQLIYQQGRGE